MHKFSGEVHHSATSPNDPANDDPFNIHDGNGQVRDCSLYDTHARYLAEPSSGPFLYRVPGRPGIVRLKICTGLIANKIWWSQLLVKRDMSQNKQYASRFMNMSHIFVDNLVDLTLVHFTLVYFSPLLSTFVHVISPFFSILHNP